MVWLFDGRKNHWSVQVINGVFCGYLGWRQAMSHDYAGAALIGIFILANASILAEKVNS